MPKKSTLAERVQALESQVSVAAARIAHLQGQEVSYQRRIDSLEKQIKKPSYTITTKQLGKNNWSANVASDESTGVFGRMFVNFSPLSGRSREEVIQAGQRVIDNEFHPDVKVIEVVA